MGGVIPFIIFIIIAIMASNKKKKESGSSSQKPTSVMDTIEEVVTEKSTRFVSEVTGIPPVEEKQKENRAPVPPRPQSAKRPEAKRIYNERPLPLQVPTRTTKWGKEDPWDDKTKEKNNPFEL